MFENVFIKDVIKKRLDKQEEKYVIYPYGENGVAVHNILSAYFGKEPVFIVDNEYAKYNPKITNVSEFKEKYETSMYIILTVENDGLNTVLENALLGFVDKEHIINLKKIRDKRREQCEIGDRFALNLLIPDNIEVFDNKYRSDKIKVRFLHSSHATWNSIRTICEAFENDDQFDLKIIILGDDDKKTEQVRSAGHQFIIDNEYDVADDLPDILVISHPRTPHPKSLVGCRKYVKMIVAASMTLIRYSSATVEEFYNYIKPGFYNFHPDYYIFDSMLYQEIKNTDIFPGEVIELGNAKFDGIYRSCQYKKIPEKWKKLQGKKILLWTTDHGIYHGSISHDITFDLYAKTLFGFAEKNKNIGLVFRPHSVLIDELISHGCWTNKDLELFRQYCDNTENVIWDDTDSYEAVFGIADAILADGFCGIICTALSTQKPICVLYRDNHVDHLHPELVNNYYMAHNIDELNLFLNTVVKDGKDEMFPLRQKAYSKYIKSFDGKNGLRIKEFIEKEFKENFL